MRLLIAMSGPVGVGKSSFADALAKLHGAERVSTRKWIIDKTGCANERGALQAAGDLLDEQTGGGWVADAVAAHPHADLPTAVLLLDSARIAGQVDALRERFGDRVLHVHLTADDDTLESRYAHRPAELKEFATYAEVKLNGTEAAIGDLAAVADLVLDADHADPATLAVAAMGWRGEPVAEVTPLVDVIVGGQYGSEGKGNVVAHLAKGYGVLVRVGGPNAGHLVADPYCKYVQLPSGTGSNPDAKILIAAGSTIWLPQLMHEMLKHGLQPDRLSIDPQAMVIDDEDRRTESGALASIATTAQGVGAASARKILNRGGQTFGPRVTLARDVKQLADYVRDVRAELDRHFADGTRVMLEGTQGTTLSIHHGHYPHVTSRETSVAGCLSDAGIAPARVRKVIMVVRTYPIRVGGTSGWMGRKVEYEELARRSGIPLEELLRVEKGTISNTQRRIGEFDWGQLRRSAVLNGATDIALTFADYLGIDNRLATSFEQLNDETRTFAERVAGVAGAPVSLISKAFAKDGVIDRRKWN